MMRALDEGRKLSGKILPTTLAETAGNGSTMLRGRRKIPEVLQMELHRCGHQGLRRTSSTHQREGVDGKVQRQYSVKLATLRGSVNPEMPDVTGWGVATPQPFFEPV